MIILTSMTTLLQYQTCKVRVFTMLICYTKSLPPCRARSLERFQSEVRWNVVPHIYRAERH